MQKNLVFSMCEMDFTEQSVLIFVNPFIDQWYMCHFDTATSPSPSRATKSAILVLHTTGYKSLTCHMW